jgi:sigma-B regulation protein RsbU (phosphoserine phosphatase)
VRRVNGEIEQDGTGGLPVGLFADAEFEEFHIKLEKGDQLLLASDGITECPDVNDVMLGEDGLEKMIRDLNGMRGPQLLETLVWMLSEYAEEAGFPDDVSAVLYEYNP